MTEDLNTEVDEALLQPLCKLMGAGKLREIVSQRVGCRRCEETDLSHSTPEQLPEPTGFPNIVLRTH